MSNKQAKQYQNVESLQNKTIDELIIRDETAFQDIHIYNQLKQVLLDGKYQFRVLPRKSRGRWDRALFLNLTFWDVSAQGDVLTDNEVPADVVAHVAWHYLAARMFAPEQGEAISSDAMYFGESIASAFDLYLMGKLLRDCPDSSFVETQVPAMAEVFLAAGESEQAFQKLLEAVVANPEQAFEDLRALLFDVTTQLLTTRNADDALSILTRFDGHRFGSLILHYELSNWKLYAQCYANRNMERDTRVRTFDQTLRTAKVSLDVLVQTWLKS